MIPRNLLTVWAELLASTLVDCGVREVVLSPGSRSTPFALALARTSGLRVTAIADERAAAFFALGIARVTRRPPLLVCTSGTAPAHYLPAVIEASESALPLLVLSADRPHRLMSCGAPQTTDQTRLFGAHTRFFAELGDPQPAGLRGLRRMIARAVAEAAHGPVHVNARADKPLEPQAAVTEEERALEAEARALGRETIGRISLGRVLPDEGELDRIAEAITRARRPAIVAGPLGVEAIHARGAVFALARHAGLALFAEASSQLRFAGNERASIACADGFDRWLDRVGAPDLVLELGATPTSAAYARWIERARPERYVLGGARFRDPSGTARAVVLGDLSAIAVGLRERVGARTIDDAFARAIASHESATWARVEAALADRFDEGTVARALVSALPDGALLGVGNSLPIRHLDRFVPGTRSLRVLSQRGVNGIDGAIAGIAGAAMADGGPAALLLGDVTFAHDVGALALAARARSPLVLVVLDNSGGRIFEQLPIGRAAGAEIELFTTPPSIDVASVAAAFGLASQSVESASELRGALAAALARSGASVICARVAPHGAAELEAALA